MPSFKDLATFLPDHLPPRGRRRSRLFYFSGDLGSPPGSVDAGPHTNPSYSLGIRQASHLPLAPALVGEYRNRSSWRTLADAPLTPCTQPLHAPEPPPSPRLLPAYQHVLIQELQTWHRR